MAQNPRRLLSVHAFTGHEATSVPLVESHPASWAGPPLRLLHNLPNRELDVPGMAENVLIVQIAGETHLEASLDHPHRSVLAQPGHVFVVPAGASSHWAWREPCEALQLILPPSLLVDALTGTDIDPGCIKLTERVAADDALLHQLGLALLAELRAGSPGGRLYVESLSQALLLHLLRCHGGHRQGRAERNRLTAAMLRQVVDYIGDNLAHDLSLQEIAALAGVSQFHFARLFREAMGMPLHAYVREQRLIQARRLLPAKELTIAAVAALTGFADQSHLSRDFKRRFGITPGSLKRVGSEPTVE